MLTKICLKFLDLRNRHLEMNFVIVFPKPSITMGSFTRFCVAYKIKLATPETLISSFEKDVSETNKIFGRLISKNKQIIDLIKKSGFEGLTRKEVSKIVGCNYYAFFLRIQI